LLFCLGVTEPGHFLSCLGELSSEDDAEEERPLLEIFSKAARHSLTFLLTHGSADWPGDSTDLVEVADDS